MPSLCSQDEDVVFACQTRKGVASICLGRGEHARKLQYRFGVQGHVELAYPETGAVPRDVFAADTLMFSGGGGAYIQFNKEKFRYTVFTAIGRWGKGGQTREVDGIAIARGDREVANLPCIGTKESRLGSDLFLSLDLKAGASGGEEGFIIPDAFLAK